MEFNNNENNLVFNENINEYQLENNENELLISNEKPKASFDNEENQLSFDAPYTPTSGSNNYEELDNLPSINNVPLIGNKTTKELGIEASGNIKGIEVNNKDVIDENGVAKISVPTKVSQLLNDSGYLTQLTTALLYYYTKKEVDNKINALPLGTVINIIETFNYMKRHQQNDIYNANAVNSSVDWTILAILEAINREVVVDINVQINPITYQIISVDKSFSDIVNVFEIGGTTRVVAQLAGTNTKIILQLALLDSSVASFTTVMKANLGQGEMKYLLGINISERYQNVVIDVLS